MDRFLLWTWCILAQLSYSMPAAPIRRGFDIANQTSLRSDLLTNYSLKIRPSPVTAVSLVFNLLAINELETRTQKFSVSGFFTVVWTDSRLAWNSASYNDIRFFFADETEVWRPALVVKNALDDLSVIANEDIPFRILDTGRVFWNPPGIYATHCEVDITYYPFDTQLCSIEVQSWAYNLRELDLIKFGTGVETKEYAKNGEWDLVEAYSQRSERVDNVDAETYATVSFIFKMQRKATYYGLNIILPVVVLALLSSLVFLLPPDSGEKMGYSLTVLLSFAVFLTLIADRMPTTSRSTSYMALYLSAILCMSGLSVLITVLILDCYFREDEVPNWLKTFTRKILMPILCLRSCKSKTGSAHITSESSGDTVQDTRLQGIREKTNMRKSAGEERKRSPSASIQGDIMWKDVSRLLDALFFRIYLIALLILSAVLFPLMTSGGTSTTSSVGNSTSA